MAGRTAVFVLLLYIQTQGASPIRWAQGPQDGSLLYACAGDTVTFDWDYVLAQGESIENVEWFYEGRSSEMIAVLTHGNFLALPAFADRVKLVQNAGLTVAGVGVEDSGNYSVQISGHDVRNFFRRSATVVLQVGGDLMTSDGKLHVSKIPAAVLDSATDQWTIELRCGTFTYLGQPPFDVEWVAPSGDILPSSHYENGQFSLRLYEPVQGGNYSCRIPDNSSVTACLSGNAFEKGRASVLVDETSARLALLEARQRALQRENAVLKLEVTDLKQGLGSPDVHTALSVAQQELSMHLNSSLQDFDGRLQHVEEATMRHVSFHARDLADASPPPDSSLVVKDVISNQGNAYDNGTGVFTAPYNGTYFLIGATGSQGTQCTLHLMVENKAVSSSYQREAWSGSGMLSVNAVLHMVEGERACLKSGGGAFLAGATTFGGFLVHADP